MNRDDGVWAASPEAEDTYQTRQTLIERLRSRYDEHSWEEFSSAYRGYIYTIIRCRNINHQDADDLTQEVVFKVWKSLPNFDHKGHFRGWLAMIARNCVVDFVRKRQRVSNTLKTAQNEAADLNEIELSDAEVLEEKEWRKYLTAKALHNIEPRYSGKAMDVFRMSVEGIPDREIAEELNLRIDSVYRLRFRVKKSLFEEIRHLREDLE